MQQGIESASFRCTPILFLQYPFWPMHNSTAACSHFITRGIHNASKLMLLVNQILIFESIRDRSTDAKLSLASFAFAVVRRQHGRVEQRQISALFSPSSIMEGFHCQDDKYERLLRLCPPDAIHLSLQLLVVLFSNVFARLLQMSDRLRFITYDISGYESSNRHIWSEPRLVVDDLLLGSASIDYDQRLDAMFNTDNTGEMFFIQGR